MFNATRLVFYYTVSPVQFGAGSAIGALDSPIQREVIRSTCCSLALASKVRKHSASAQQQRTVRQHDDNSVAYAFPNLLTGPELLDKVESLLPAHRERLFPPAETLSMFLSQALSADRCCQQAAINPDILTIVDGGSPTEDLHPITSCPCWAYTSC